MCSLGDSLCLLSSSIPEAEAGIEGAELHLISLFVYQKERASMQITAYRRHTTGIGLKFIVKFSMARPYSLTRGGYNPFLWDITTTRRRVQYRMPSLPCGPITEIGPPTPKTVPHYHLKDSQTHKSETVQDAIVALRRGGPVLTDGDRSLTPCSFPGSSPRSPEIFQTLFAHVSDVKQPRSSRPQG